MSIAPKLAGKYPGTFLLDPNDLPGLAQYLQNRQWIGPQETIHRAERAGESNMNCTLRIQTSERSFILKQARPWVEKYPHILAPWNRAEMEARFYQTVCENEQLAQYMPKLLGYDSAEHVLMLEDLGVALDFTFLYRKRRNLV
jgi:5-methylthioribose kinase